MTSELFQLLSRAFLFIIQRSILNRKDPVIYDEVVES